MRFSGCRPKLALNRFNIHEDDSGDGPVCLNFPVHDNNKLESLSLLANNDDKANLSEEDGMDRDKQLEARIPNGIDLVQLWDCGYQDLVNQMNGSTHAVMNNKGKRPSLRRTSEEVESQKMAHIANEKNRRRLTNERLMMLKSLMPSSYVKKGDQASIVGGTIEFVRELEEHIQHLETQKRQRLNVSSDGGAPNNDVQIKADEGRLREDKAENKSCLANVEVKLQGSNATIEILSKRRSGQLMQTIAALEDLQLTILQINISTIEHTVLYTFDVKVAGETRFTGAENLACSVQQIFSSIHESGSNV